MGRKILVIVEHKDGHIKNVSRETLSYCSAAGKKVGYNIKALIYGRKIDKEIYTEIANCGVEDIFSIEAENLVNHNPELIHGTIVKVINNIEPGLIIFGNTAIGKDLVPCLAQYFSSAMISDVINIDFGINNIDVTRPIYGGKVLENIKILNGEMVFITVRPNVIGVHETVHLEPNIVNVELEKITRRTYIVKDVLKKAQIELPINEAEIIVAGGRAFKKIEDFEILEELAKVLGATVGASRPVVDLGIKRRSLQIGQSGKSVSPRLIIVCGISGQIQFVAGIANAKTVISINKDPDATIFKTSDYGIVGDVFKIVPLLTKEFKKILIE
ncbi:electron transfer flavoprotein subunit alpha/FixB family protein [Wukongibacter baidiensis]|uniref:electron transfer flavoprotein subunit alpha/FixB family protein n=1 Tax=Wukongibacter baidiensis TaxID=1723361 RepID=UPI003D7F2571